MNLAVRDIRHNFGRFALTTVGVGMLLMIVMGMGGIYRGIIEDATLLADRIGAELFVQHNTRGPFAEVSRVPSNLVYRALAVPGVVTAREFVYHTIQRERGGKPIRIAVVGLSWPTDKGESLPFVAGRPLAQSHFEMIADRSLGLQLGESINLGKENYTVVGVTEDMIGTSGDGLAFFTIQDALDIQFDVPGEAVRLEREARRVRGVQSDYGRKQPSLTDLAFAPPSEIPALGPRQIAAVMVNIQPGTSQRSVAAIIDGWSDVSVYTAQEQRDLLLKGPVEKVRRQIGLFRVLLTIIAAIIMALILYTLTLDKLHDIALLKLIGAPNSKILGLILQEALLLGVVGFGIAYVVGMKIFPYFPRRVILTDGDIAQLGVAVVIISVLSSVLGIWKAMRVEPNEALSG
ncbi:MAG: ABC transporter permease [Planctomycetes bacterium]|nr:ABC transporter permease [Planctomycetota bacterium]